MNSASNAMTAHRPPGGDAAGTAPRRRCRVAILGSFTTVQLARTLPPCALRQGIEVTVWEGPFNQCRQELLNPKSELYLQRPDFIVIAVHEGDLTLPFVCGSPADEVACETARWTGLWAAAAVHSAARVIQFNFAIPPEAAMGHLAARWPGSRYAMIQAVNAGLGAAAGTSVRILDCERLSALVGKRQWFDPRYWHLSRQAVSLHALPDVDVLALPQDPSHYARFLFDYLGFERTSFTAEDMARTDQCRARRGGSAGAKCRLHRGVVEEFGDGGQHRAHQRSRCAANRSAHRQDQPVQCRDTAPQPGPGRGVRSRPRMHPLQSQVARPVRRSWPGQPDDCRAAWCHARDRHMGDELPRDRTQGRARDACPPLPAGRRAWRHQYPREIPADSQEFPHQDAFPGLRVRALS